MSPRRLKLEMTLLWYFVLDFLGSYNRTVKYMLKKSGFFPSQKGEKWSRTTKKGIVEL